MCADRRRLTNRVEPGGDRCVVGGGCGEGLAGQRTPGLGADLTTGADLVEHERVVGGVDDDGDAVVVLRRRPHHRRTTDVDQLDSGIGGEGIEVDDDEVDRLDAVLGEVGAVRWVRRVGEDAAVDLGMESHDTVAEDRRESREFGDVGDRHPDGGDLPGGTTARQHPPAGGVQALGELDDP